MSYMKEEGEAEVVEVYLEVVEEAKAGKDLTKHLWSAISATN